MRKVVSAPGLDIPGVSREAGKMGAQREREKKAFLEAALLGMYPPHTNLKEAMAGVQSFETNRLNHTIRQFFNEASIFAGSITCLAKDHLQLRMLLQEQRDHRQLGILMTHNEKLELLLRHRIAQTEKSGADRGFSAAPDVAGVPDANGLPGEDTGPDPQKRRALLEALQQTLPEEMLPINDSPPQAFSVVFQTLKDNRKMKNNLEEERQRLNAELVELNQQKGMLEELSQRDDLKLFLAPLLLEYPQKRQKSQQKVEGQL